MRPLKLDLRRATVLLVCLMSTLLMATRARPEGKHKLKLGAKGQLCLKCHETFQKTIKSPYVHPLMKRGECSACHEPHTSSHKGLLTAGPTRLCSNCHKDVMPEKAQKVHMVVAEGKCNKCHDPHGSDNQFQLVNTGNELCFDCHQDMGNQVKKNRFKHKPLNTKKGCLNCHNPHASEKSDFLLKKDAPSLCVECHDTGKPSFSRKHMNYPVAKTNCGSCHDPHGSNDRGMVFADAHVPVSKQQCSACHQEPTSANPLKTKWQGTELCMQCHKKLIDKTLNQNRTHWPLVDQTGCLNCHGPHATKQGKLLKRAIVDLCGRCHSDTVELQKWSISNPKNPKLCEPVKTGNCIACHSPHASDNVLLISQESISIELCGRCHEWQTHSTHPIGEKVVDQRNRNLTVECLSCHKACGTGNKPAMMPFATVYDLCIQCHTERKR